MRCSVEVRPSFPMPSLAADACLRASHRKLPHVARRRRGDTPVFVARVGRDLDARMRERAAERVSEDAQSVRNASSGLSRAARRAGSQHARSAMPSRNSVVTAKTAGSRGLMP